jgi:protease IV
MSRSRIVPAILLAGAGLLVTADAHAQRQIAEEPTGGVHLPATPLAGEHDARATSVNPAGLQFVGGFSLALAIDAAGEERATGGGTGVGLYLASAMGGGLLPRLGLGLGLEWLDPPRARLTPDPGAPVRTTVATSLGLGPRAALGVSWHHFFDDAAGSAVAGLDTWDVGLSWRLGNHLALGGVVRDLGAPVVAAAPVQRRYELEVTGRPTGTDRLDLGVGGRIGEIRADVDGWLRASARLRRGLYLHAAAETRALHVIEPLPGGGEVQREDRDLRVSLGLEVSLGGLGVSTYATGALDETGARRLAGGTLLARLSTPQVPAVQGRPARIEKIELSGGLGVRSVTRHVLRLRALARDPAVQAVVITIDGVRAGWASVQELRQEIERLRGAGKKVFAYLVAGSTRDYFLASACDKVYVDPAGGLRLTGFAGTTLYFRGAFEQIGVSAEFEKIAEYKSAPESWTDIGPSAPALQMRDELYDSMFDELLEGIARGRGLDRTTVDGLVRGGPYSAGDLAKDKRLVDAVADPDQVAELIKVELGRLYPVGQAPAERDDRWERPAIAVIYADGDIVDGTSQEIPILGRKLVGSETIIAALQAARRDPRVKAVVIRIDSPGGSATASELMSREVFKTRGVKPIICSMSDVAASGGYFLAAGCDHVFAEPMTITGSIGIFYGKFDLSGLLAKLGIASVTVTRGERADMDSLYRPYTDEERVVIRDKLVYLYGRFTGTVARGRKMSEKQVDEVGRGRVWSGRQAQAVGLVDSLGGVADALDHAKRQAGLSERDLVRIIELPRPTRGLLQLLLGSVAQAGAGAPGFDLGQLAAVREALLAVPASLVFDPTAPQARLPFEVIWE